MPFDHEKLDVYRLAIEFVARANEIIEHLPRGRGYLSDQLQRAALSGAGSGATGAVLAYKGPGGVFNVSDDAPAPPQDVITYAAMLMGIEPPPEQDVEAAGLSPVARSFYAENKRVSNRKLKDELGVKLIFPTYRVGLEALWEAGEGR